MSSENKEGKRGRDGEYTIGSESYEPKQKRNVRSKNMSKVIILDGKTLTPEQLFEVGKGDCKLEISHIGWSRIASGAGVVEKVLKEHSTVYGINTGFGKFANVSINSTQLAELQENLIRSHATGIGEPLPVSTVRRIVALRLNCFARGNSGIRPANVERILAAFNAGIVPRVPSKGTVGASGDLAPLAHVALGYMGEGEVHSIDALDVARGSEDDSPGASPEAAEPATGGAVAKMSSRSGGVFCAAGEVFEALGLEPIKLAAKEGLAMINGTQFMCAITAEALVRAEHAAVTADAVAAFSLEVLRGTSTAFDPSIHAARPHVGQGEVAARVRDILGGTDGSELAQSHRDCDRVQDSYTLRCIPQVHGVVHDTLKFCRGIVQTEMNSSTDNPMCLAESGRLLSGGNFHGEYIAKAADFLGIAIHEISSISERRIERLNNSELSSLPAFLVREGGLNSGFMIAHCAAASLVSENMVLVHPSSSHSISTSAAKEDHVSMGGFAARKALTITEHVETVVAIELLCACQGLDLLRPLKTSPVLEAVYDLVRAHVTTWDKDRYMAPDVEAVRKLVSSGEIVRVIKPFLQ